MHTNPVLRLLDLVVEVRVFKVARDGALYLRSHFVQRPQAGLEGKWRRLMQVDGFSKLVLCELVALAQSDVSISFLYVTLQ